MSTFAFTRENEAKFQALLGRYPKKSSLMLPSLWMVQYQEGWISPEAMQFVASKLECSAMDVYSVASFYTMFLLQPIGTYHLQLCKTLSCMLAGSKTLQEHLQNRLGIKAGETVVTAGQLKLRNGAPVFINNSIQPSNNPHPEVKDQ